MFHPEQIQFYRDIAAIIDMRQKGENWVYICQRLGGRWSEREMKDALGRMNTLFENREVQHVPDSMDAAFRIYEQRIAGQSYMSIAREHHITLADAYNAVRKAYHQECEHIRHDPDMDRVMAAKRLDRLTEIAMIQLEANRDDYDCASKAIKDILMIESRRAAYYGLDMKSPKEPESQEVNAVWESFQQLMNATNASDVSETEI